MASHYPTHSGRPGRLLLVGASALALVAAASADAQTATGTPVQSSSDTGVAGDVGTPASGSLPRDASGTQAAVPPSQAGTTQQDDGDAGASDIVVTGLRQSVATAQALKFNSDQFVDSITATDIGKLPDKNVAEALQRISGVQISRNYGEGSGIAIRGLTQVKTELNGRDVFGGSNGRALGFEDVPSELLAGVDVYKNPSAKEIEGGIGGLINLRTRMPFDEKGSVLSASMGANYFDLAKDARFNGSVLASKTWSNTPIGDIGILVDASYYEGTFRRDQATIEPYVPSTTVPGYVGQTIDLPDGAGIQVTEGRRKRKGLYAAVQWAPADNVEVYGTYFRSQYDLYTPNYSSFVTNSTSTDYLNYMTPGAASNFKFSPSGTFISGGYNGFIPAYSGIVPGYPDYSRYVNTALNIADNTQVSFGRTVTTEYAGGVKWSPTERLHATADFQYERATANVQSYTVFAQQNTGGYNIDLSGDLPAITFTAGPGNSLTNLAQYNITALMDHFENSVATQKAGRLDLAWDFDNSFLTSVQGGIRYTERDAVNRSTPYNWTAATAGTTLASAGIGGIISPYGTLFDGAGSNIIGSVGYVSAALFDNAAAAFQTFAGRGLTTFGPLDVNTQQEKTYASYLTAYFKFDAGLPIDGNLAVRVVKTDNNASGISQITYRTDLLATTLNTTTVNTPFSAGTSYTKVLPSLNVRAHLTDRLQLRGAASEGLSRPDFSQLTAVRSFSVGYNQITATNPDGTTTVTGYALSNNNTGSAGNPLLKPLTTHQADLALEWNASRTTFLYGTVFYKKLNNFIYSATSNVTVAVPGQASQSFLTTGYFNGTNGKIQGAEVGGNTFFDFLPGPLAGLGMQANATYVDSNAPGATGTLQNGTKVATPLQGLSKWSYNVVGLYEKYGLSARAAYNWRSSYVVDTAGNGTGGVPIYNRAYGQLDASISYNFTPKVSMTIDAINLTRSRYDSYQYYATNPRNYELNDRRFGLTFRMRN